MRNSLFETLEAITQNGAAVKFEKAYAEGIAVTLTLGERHERCSIDLGVYRHFSDIHPSELVVHELRKMYGRLTESEAEAG